MAWTALVLAFAGAVTLTALAACLVFSLLTYVGEVLQKVDSIKDQPK